MKKPTFTPVATAVVPISDVILLARAGEAANHAASRSVFKDYQSRKAKNTLRRQANDLALFASFLRGAGLQAANFEKDPKAWSGITWGLVEGFARWQLQNGYAVPSVNVRLATVKTYAKLAMKAGVLDSKQYALIKSVQGYSFKEGKRIDDQRREADVATRKGAKKSEAVSITPKQAVRLMKQPNTPQGRRDSLLMCLLLDHGLRVGEAVILEVKDFDLQVGELTFYRPKVDKTQTHKLTNRTLKALKAYAANDAPKRGSIWRASASKKDGRKKVGTLTNQGATERGLTKRVKTLGEAIGLVGLSAHDCRHYWATQAARNNTPVDRLQDAGGWNSPAMPLRYVQKAKISNQGVRLG